MARRACFTRVGAFSAGVVVLALGLLVREPVSATLRYGALQLSGDFSTQNLVRHRSPDDFQFVQNRNVARIRVDWDWIEKGMLMERISIPFIKRSTVFLLYRGVYDGFYDIAPSDRQSGVSRFDDLVGGPIVGNRAGTVNPDGSLKGGLYSRLNKSDRDRLKFENTLREAYVDLKLADYPVSFRLGRQQVIWGESDVFRLMDIWNPLDVTWHLQQEDWDRIRVPLWMLKGIWDIGSVGPISNTFVEVVYNPGDFQPGLKTAFLPRPWGIPVPNPVRDGQIQMPSTTQPILLTPVFDFKGTSLRQGDFKRNPQDASAVGFRLHGVTRQGIELTTNYIYTRGRGIGSKASSPFALKIEEIVIPATLTPANAFPGTFENQPVFPANVTAEFIHPYVHIFGLTGNYFEGSYTNTVFRMEMAYELGTPFQTADLDQRVPVIDTRGEERPQISPLGFTKRDMWAGMIGFDRPTWIKFLNARTTYFLTGQFFWSYVNGKVAGLRGSVLSASEAPYFTPSDNPFLPANVRSNGVGQWTSGPFAGLVERTQTQDLSTGGALFANADTFRRWELLMTFAATSFYRGGTMVPFFATGIDLVNSNLLTQFKFDYFLTNNFIIQFQQKFYTAYGRKTSLDPWGAGGLNRRRDETGVKFTYQF